MNNSGDVKVCQMCLAMDVKLYNMQTYSLETYLESIIGHNTLSALELPPYICYECTSLARKYYLFKERCLRGQRVLYDILHKNGKITVNHIRQIDRDSFELTSNLNINVVLAEEIFNSNSVESDLEIKKEIEKDDVNELCFKQEDHDSLPQITVMSKEELLTLYKTKKKNIQELPHGHLEQIKDIEKDEVNDECFIQEGYDSISQMTVSTNEEPLSLHKTKKRNIQELPHGQSENIETHEVMSLESAGIAENIKVKRTVDKINLEEYVTIKKLSMPLTGAERQKRYMERLKIEQPENYVEKRKKHLTLVKQRRKKIASLSEEEKNIRRKKWRQANKKRKDKKNIFLQKQNVEKLKKGEKFELLCIQK